MEFSSSQREIVICLCQQLIYESEFIVREEIVIQLGEMGDEVSIPTLMELLQQDPDPLFRKLVVKALGKIYQKREERQILILKEMIVDWQTTYPDPRKVTNSEIVDIEFTPIPEKDPQKWQGIMDVLSLVFVGGIETVKMVFAPAGIPIEVAKRLYEIYLRRKNQ
jgi:hypothetical protein